MSCLSCKHTETWLLILWLLWIRLLPLSYLFLSLQFFKRPTFVLNVFLNWLFLTITEGYKGFVINQQMLGAFVQLLSLSIGGEKNVLCYSKSTAFNLKDMYLWSTHFWWARRQLSVHTHSVLRRLLIETLWDHLCRWGITMWWPEIVKLSDLIITCRRFWHLSPSCSNVEAYSTTMSLWHAVRGVTDRTFWWHGAVTTVDVTI